MKLTNGRTIRRWAAAGLTTVTLAVPLIASGSHSGSTPVSKRCVDGRQTEDPNSPPCVPFYQGENQGATWQGVTPDEVKVLIYLSAAITTGGDGPPETPPAGTYCDVDLLDCDGDGLLDQNSHAWMRVAYAYSRYFNDRFQTYGRRVHPYIYWSGAESVAARRADAADNWETVTPFAVLNQATFGGHHETYSRSMALRQSMVFGNLENSSRSFFQDNAPFLWDWWPDVEANAAQYVSYVCSKVAGTTVTSGQFAGEERRYAIYGSTDPTQPGDQELTRLVRQGVENCGITIEDQYSFPYSGWGIDTEGDRSYAAMNAAQMKLAGINTVLWAGGTETDTSKFAELALYSPEWVVSGDGLMESAAHARQQGQTSWSNAWVVSSRPRVGSASEDPAIQAYREADPEGHHAIWASRFYTDWFLLFMAIQVAGPELTPITVHSGLRAMPARQSTGPYSVSGSFPEGQFTFVKDASEGWWDPTAQAPDGELGCYRLVSSGLRYSLGGWANATGAGLGSEGNERDALLDPCSGYSHSMSIRPGIPSPPAIPDPWATLVWPQG